MRPGSVVERPTPKMAQSRGLLALSSLAGTARRANVFPLSPGENVAQIVPRPLRRFREPGDDVEMFRRNIFRFAHVRIQIVQFQADCLLLILRRVSVPPAFAAGECTRLM